MTTWGSALAGNHRALLGASAVDPDVASERGYVTATEKAALERFGFPASQRIVPALLVPLWSLGRAVTSYQSRPDEPRWLGGRAVRYETPKGAPNVLDVHPRMADKVGDPNVPLLVTEGVRKGDAAVSRLAVPIVSLAGVWSWRGSNGDGGKLALGAWEDVALKGRSTFVVFDSDVVMKETVHDALSALGGYLGHKGADVWFVYLPHGPNGTKVGLDDFVAAGGDLDALVAHGTRELRRFVVGAPPVDAPDDFADVPDEPGAAVLDDLVVFFDRFLSVPSPAYLEALALWTLHSHAIDAFYETPRLAVVSPEKGSGKTRVLELVELTARRPRHTVSMSGAYMFRRIEADTPTLLIDEADTIFGATSSSDHEDERAIVNAGHRRGATVGRCVGEGSKQEPVDFTVFCPVALAGIGTLPPTIIDRSVVLTMRKRRPDELVEPFRRQDVEEDGYLLRRRLAAWAHRHHDALAAHRPTMAAGVVDRAADVWSPLVVVADVAGGDWPGRARRACLELQGARAYADTSTSVRLLTDILAVFDEAGADRLTSDNPVTRLTAIEESGWGQWGRARKPITASWLARQLRPFDLRPKAHRIGDGTPRGYLAADFVDAWARYLPDDPANIVFCPPGTRNRRNRRNTPGQPCCGCCGCCAPGGQREQRRARTDRRRLPTPARRRRRRSVPAVSTTALPTFPELLAGLERRRLVPELRDGRVVLIGDTSKVDAVVAVACRWYAIELRAAVVARSMGHVPGVCCMCGEWTFIRPDDHNAWCRLTPGCGAKPALDETRKRGRHVPVAELDERPTPRRREIQRTVEEGVERCPSCWCVPTEPRTTERLPALVVHEDGAVKRHADGRPVLAHPATSNPAATAATRSAPRRKHDSP